MKRKLIMLVVISTLLVGCAAKTTNQKSESNENYDEILMEVMQSKRNFIDENNETVTLANFEIVDGVKAVPSTYAYIDLDGDSINELVMLATTDYGAYVIFHYENNQVYGYVLGIRSFESLKKDGTFIGSSGAASNSYYSISFDKNTYRTKTLAIYDELSETYQIDGVSVQKEEIKDYANKFNSLENVQFTEYKK